MKSIEISGKTVKDAIKNGLAELGCDSSDVDIQVLEMGSPGLFGMFGRPAKVKLTVKDKGSDMDIEMPVLSLDQPSGKRREEKRKDKPKAEKKPEPKPEKKPEQPKPEKAEQPEAEQPEAEAQAEDKPRPEKKRRRSRGEKKPAAEPAANEQPAEVVIAPVETEPFVATPEEELSDTAKSARAFLSGLTERMGVPAEIAVSDSPEQLRMVLSG